MARSQRKLAWSDDEFAQPYFSEPPLARRRRLAQQAKDGKKALEIERSGSIVNFERAAKRLKHACAENRVLRVPQWDMEKAVKAMRDAGVNGSVSNLCGSKFTRVRPKAANSR